MSRLLTIRGLRLLVIAASSAVPPCAWAQVRQEWVAFYEGSETRNIALSIDLDDEGNILVTGQAGSLQNSHFATVKYDGAGRAQWVRKYTGRQSGFHEPVAVEADDFGNVLVAGTAPGEGTQNLVLVKYSPEGEQLWEAFYGSGAQTSDRASALVLDTQGNIYVTGSSRDERGFLIESSTLKFSPEGKRLWNASYRGYTHDIAVDPAGNVHVTGQRIGSTPGAWEFGTAKYGPDGSLMWLAGHRFRVDIARAIAIDSEGNVYVTGEAGADPGTLDLVTIGYDANGSQRWIDRYNGPGDHLDSGCCIAVDRTGNVYVGGVSTGGSRDYLVIKYSRQGNRVWLAWYEGPGRGDDLAQALTLDGAGNVLITGHSSVATTVKYAPLGEQLWAASYTGPGVRILANDIAVDAEGNAYVTGMVDLGNKTQYLTLKYVVPDNFFLRGDCNADGVLDGVSDAVFQIQFGFLAGPEPACLAACDANGDGEVIPALADALYVLQFAFSGGPSPPTPYPRCGSGTLASDEAIGCTGPPDACQ